MFLTCNSAYQADDEKYFFETISAFMTTPFITTRDKLILSFTRYTYADEKISKRKNTDPSNLSRDNMIGLLICLGHFKYTEALKTVAKQILRRGSFYQNTRTYLDHKLKIPDFCGPVSWAVILKGLGYKFILLDLVVLFMSLYCVLKAKLASSHASTVFHEVSTFHFLRKNSFLTKLAYLVYTTYRAPVQGYPDASGVISALKYYSRADYDPNIYDITRAMLRRTSNEYES